MMCETQIVANDNECRERAVLFDASAIFGGLALASGWARHIRKRAASDEPWLEGALPKWLLDHVCANRTCYHVVEIPFAEGESPEIDEMMADLFSRSGLPAHEARERMQRFEVAVTKAIKRSGHEAAV